MSGFLVSCLESVHYVQVLSTKMDLPVFGVVQLKDNVCAEDESDVQFMPFKIDCNARANVQNYFNVYTKEESGFLRNAIRGRPVIGSVETIPSGYRGVVLQKTGRLGNVDAECSFRTKFSFKNYIHWNYDKEPTTTEPLKQAMEFQRIAEELSKPINEEEVLEELQRCKHKFAAKKETDFK